MSSRGSLNFTVRVTWFIAAIKEAFIESKSPLSLSPLSVCLSLFLSIISYVCISLLFLFFFVLHVVRYCFWVFVHVRVYCRVITLSQLRGPVQCNVAHMQCVMRIAAAAVAAATSSSEHGPVREIETTTRGYNGMLTSDANCCLARTTHTDMHELHTGECVRCALTFWTGTGYVSINRRCAMQRKQRAFLPWYIRIFMHETKSSKSYMKKKI